MKHVSVWSVYVASVLGLLLSCAISVHAKASDSVPSGYRQIAAEYGIPASVFYAMALAESGRQLKQVGHRPWPWTLNVEGKAYYYDSRIALHSALNAFLSQGIRSIDIGLMQVNWKYHADKLQDTWSATEPYFNLRVAAVILLEQYRHTDDDWWAAVGRYHSPGHRDRAQRYSQRVQRLWQRVRIT